MIVLTEEQEERLRDAAEEYGVTFRDNYSGRGMYGDSCIGFVFDSGHMHGVTMALIDALGIDLANEITTSRTDNMGLDTIIYYPGVKTQAAHLAHAKGHD